MSSTSIYDHCSDREVGNHDHYWKAYTCVIRPKDEVSQPGEQILINEVLQLAVVDHSLDHGLMSLYQAAVKYKQVDEEGIDQADLVKDVGQVA